MPHELPWRIFQQLVDRYPLERAVGDQAWMIGPIAQNPGFPNRTVARQRNREQVCKAASTPGPILVDRLKSERVERYLVDGAPCVSVRFAIVVPR